MLISFVISIWMLVIMVIAVRTVLDYTSTGRAIVVCLIGFVAYLILNMLVIVPLMTMRAILG